MKEEKTDDIYLGSNVDVQLFDLTFFFLCCDQRFQRFRKHSQ